MRALLILILISLYAETSAQKMVADHFKNDSLLVIQKDPKRGFNYDYILFIPKGTPKQKDLVLLVEPNNSGLTSDSMEVHLERALKLASVSSVGNNVSTYLKIPLLVPVFPRPASQPLMYTHALDRDVLLEKSSLLERLDLQLLAMVGDARERLTSLDIRIHPKFFMNGFSASGTFTNRFALIHPEKIKALAIGGFNGKLMLPQPSLNDMQLHYPLGTHDFKELFGRDFDKESFRSIPQFVYMGELDDNDAVLFDDAYNEKERQIIQKHIGQKVTERYLACQQFYKENNIEPIFRLYENVGHRTTTAINLEIIQFFSTHLN